MNSHRSTGGPSLLPSAGELLAAILSESWVAKRRAAGPRAARLDARTVRRSLRGPMHTKDDLLHVIEMTIEAMASVEILPRQIIEDVLPQPGGVMWVVNLPGGPTPGRGLLTLEGWQLEAAKQLLHLSQFYGSVVTELEQPASREQSTTELTYGVMRLFVPELALRYAALHLLEDHPIDGSSAPAWSQEVGSPQWFRALVAGLPKEGGLNLLSADLGVGTETLRRWMNGSGAPRGELLDKMIDAINGRGDMEAVSARDAGRFFLAWRLSARLARVLTWPRVRELAHAVVRMAARMADYHRRQGLSEGGARRLLVEYLVRGTSVTLSRNMIKAAWELEEDAEWREDLHAVIAADAVGRMQLRMQTLLRQKDMDQARALFEAGEPELPPLGGVEWTPVAAGLFELAERMMFEAKWPEARDVLQRAVSFQPDLPMLQRRLGVCQVATGDLDGALLSFGMANALAREWEAPYLDLAFVRIQLAYTAEAKGLTEEAARHYDTALQHLQAMPASSGQPAAMHAFLSGQVRFHLRDWLEALRCFENAISAGYMPGRSYDLAACCAFEAGEVRKGWRYAKEGNARGHGLTFRMWRNQEFRRRRRPGKSGK